MKNTMKTIRNKAIAAKCNFRAAAEAAVRSKKAEFYINKGVGIIICLALGVILLTAMSTVWKDTIIPNISTKITEMFSIT